MGRRGLVGLFVMYKSHSGSAVRIPSSTFSFEECIVWGKDDEEEEELERVKREGRGGRRRHSNQERQQEEKGFRYVFEDD